MTSKMMFLLSSSTCFILPLLGRHPRRVLFFFILALLISHFFLSFFVCLCFCYQPAVVGGHNLKFSVALRAALLGQFVGGWQQRSRSHALGRTIQVVAGVTKKKKRGEWMELGKGFIF